MKYRKKPVEVEAFQFDGDLMGSDGKYYVPGWAVRAFKTGVMHYKYGIDAQLYIKTLEGEHHASVGDYIIRGVKGELYPCKPDIFEMTYEPIPDEEPAQLKPCPFCGGEAVIRTIGPLCNWEAIMHTIEPHSHYFADMPDCLGSTFIECLSCNCALSADTEQKAIRAWNRRA